MAGFHVEVVTAERQILSTDDVEQVTIPTVEGEISVRPHHIPLIGVLAPGELRIRQRGVDSTLAVSGGFLEVTGTYVRVLADAAERADEIDVARAQAAEQRARALLAHRGSAPSGSMDFASAAASLRRSQIRLRVARRRRVDLPTG